MGFGLVWHMPCPCADPVASHCICAGLNASNHAQHTPLHVAAVEGTTHQVLGLLDVPGVDLHAVDGNGHTPEELAMHMQDYEMATLFAEHAEREALVPPFYAVNPYGAELMPPPQPAAAA